MKVLSLFDGISCGMIALERAGFEVARYVAYEIDKYAIQVSKNNYPNIERGGDVTKAYFSKYKGFDIIMGGSPCTYWSIARKDREITSNGLGFELFSHFARAIKEVKPKFFIYENNNSIHKDIKAEITKVLGVDFTMINSALVSAQNRKRCYWVGKLNKDGNYNTVSVPLPCDKGLVLKDILVSGLTDREKARTVTASVRRTTMREYFLHHQNTMSIEPVAVAQRGRYINSGNRHTKVEGGTYQVIEAREDSKSNCVTTVHKDCMVCTPINVGHIGNSNGQGNRVYKIDGKSVCIQARSGGLGAKTGLYAIPLYVGELPGNNGLRKNGNQPAQQYRVHNSTGKSLCVDTDQRKHYAIAVEFNGNVHATAISTADGKEYPVYEVIDKEITYKDIKCKLNLPNGYYIIRKLIPVEAERLQTLPDNYTEGISNTQRYKCIGNGWTVDVIAHILKGLKR